MSEITEDISKSLRVVSMAPLDDKAFVKTLSSLSDLGKDASKAFSYYDGLRVFCLEDRTVYEWKETAYGETGVVAGGFAYPPNTVVDDIDYSGRIFNFVQVDGASGGASQNLFFVEPSVNIEKQEGTAPSEAMFFGKYDMGSGLEDAALFINSFAVQSNFDIKGDINVGAEIKMVNGTNGKYLGHFKVTANNYNGYRVMDIIEKGDWQPIGKFLTQAIVIHVVKEAPYALEQSGNTFSLKKGNAVLSTIDLGPMLDGAGSGSTITGGTVDNQGIATFTRGDATTFDVDFSALFNNQPVVAKASTRSPQGGAVYENVFVTKAVNGSMGQGLYAADLSTNYNKDNFAGFPYPTSGRDYLICKYNNNYFLLIKKELGFTRLFSEPDQVLGFSFFSYNNNTDKSMRLQAYFKIITRRTELFGLNANYLAYPITGVAGTNFPKHSAGEPNEIYIKQTNEANAWPLITQIAKERNPLKKSVLAPYTLKAEDNGRILFVTNGGEITVPILPYGFECGFVQTGTEQVTFAGGIGVTLHKPFDKLYQLEGKYYSVYLVCEDEKDYRSGTVEVSSSDTSNTFALIGDLARGGGPV